MTKGVVEWPLVLDEAKRLADERGDAFDPAVFDNLSDVIAHASADTPAPLVGLGYWPTIQLSWPSLSLEVFEDRIEVYPASPPGVTCVWYEPHAVGQPFSDAFRRDLSMVLSV
ncbi:hypothetical protein [Brevundimonas sp.]